MQRSGYSIWFTGLSGSGKSSIADELAFALKDAGLKVQRIDENVLLHDILNKEYANSKDEDLMVKIAVFSASALICNSIIPIISLKLTRDEQRKFVKDHVPDSILIYNKCKIEECENRDPHSLFTRVREGEIKDIPGVDGVFEEPDNAEIIINTYIDDIKNSTKAIIGYLDFNGYLSCNNDSCHESPGQAYTDEQSATIKKRLEDLGYL